MFNKKLKQKVEDLNNLMTFLVKEIIQHKGQILEISNLLLKSSENQFNILQKINENKKTKNNNRKDKIRR